MNIALDYLFYYFKKASILHIKNMVCNRCIKAVQDEIEKLGFTIQSIELGEVVLKEEADNNDTERLSKALAENGFELNSDSKSRIINRIKTQIIEYIHYDKEKPGYVNFSAQSIILKDEDHLINSTH